MFYLKYHLYRHYFPLFALARYADSYAEGLVRFPLTMTASMTKYIAGKRLRGVDKFPLVMMLEPLHACNLTCTGCGRIREYADTIKEKLTVEQCLAAAEECGAPIVSICGGEPMIYPEIGRLVSEIIGPQKAHLSVHQRNVHPETAARVQADVAASSSTCTSTGWNKRTTCASSATACFDEAIEGIKAAKEAGFLVCYEHDHLQRNRP